MKSVRMKGRSVEEAVNAALAVLGVDREKARVRVIFEGKPAVMGIIGGEEAEVEVFVLESIGEEARQALQNILDKMGFLAVADLVSEDKNSVKLLVKGEDMGRIIGKGGAMLKALEVIVAAILWKMFGDPIHVAIDAGGYKEKRVRALERLARDVAEEVVRTGEEKVLPFMEASDRRIIHVYLANNSGVITFSKGEGKNRRLVVAPKK